MSDARQDEARLSSAEQRAIEALERANAERAAAETPSPIEQAASLVGTFFHMLIALAVEVLIAVPVSCMFIVSGSFPATSKAGAADFATYRILMLLVLVFYALAAGRKRHLASALGTSIIVWLGASIVTWYWVYGQ